jgi:superfamily II DNA or RNA helicase
MPTTARAEVIKKFRNGGLNDPRVLVLSNVGMTGLNLPCANILIMMASKLFVHANFLTV